MANTFNKHFLKRLLSSTALIGALLFSNPISVSAEDSIGNQPVEDIPTEELQDTYEQENTEIIVDEVEKAEDSSDVEDSAPSDPSSETDKTEKTDEESEESETDEPSKVEDEQEIDEQADIDETDEALEESENSDDTPVTDEESDVTDGAASEDKETEHEETEDSKKNEVSDDEESTDSEETSKDSEKDSEEDSKDEEETDETESEKDTEDSETENTLSEEDMEFFSSFMSSYASTASLSTANVDDSKVERISGKNRFEVAAKISQRNWNTSDLVILSNGFKTADALTGSSLASTYDAPMLFTRDTHIPDATLQEINRLGAKNVIVLGGNHSVPQHITDTLAALNVSIDRIEGRTRYHVASEIADRVMESEGENRDAFLVNGEAYADAISIAPVASGKRLPIFLTRPNVLHEEVIAAIPRVNSWTIVGGTKSIPTSIVSEMEQRGAEISKRHNGQNRYEVNREIVQYYNKNDDYVYVASGREFADALATSVPAGKESASILLVGNGTEVVHEQTDYIKNQQKIENYVIVGGTDTLTKRTENHFEEPLVYVDPGHGGWETGTAHYGIVEKDLNLSISFKLRDRLEDYGYEVVMSRTDDSQVDLYDRPAEANALGADIFVSVHNNAMPGSSAVHGIENYYYQYDESDTYKPQYPVGSDAWNKATSQHRDNESKRLADAIHNELIADTGAADRGTREMGFAVIRETFMPAVLLELGYVSNYNEAHRLNTDSYQRTLANAVIKGINNYFMI